MSYRENITRIKAVHNALGPLQNEVVYVGGATVSLYADRQTLEVRPTDDIDIVIEIATRREYTIVETQLRKMGFVNDQESGIICRYKIHGITVDVMPTDESILGFKNEWYQQGFRDAEEFVIDDLHRVKIFSSIYFLASKFDAFKDRGNNDGRSSTDFEDIIYVLNNRSTIWEEMENSTEEVRRYLKVEIKSLIENKYLEEWISSHLDYHEQARVNFIRDGLENFISPNL